MSIRIDDIVVSAESRMADLLLDTYQDSASRNFVDKFAQTIDTDGSEYKIRIRELDVKFATSKRTDDRRNYTNVGPGVVKTFTTDYSHVGLPISGRQYRDSDGAVPELMAEWAVAVGDSAAIHTMQRALELFKANAPSAIDDQPMFGPHTLLSGQAYDNRIQGDLTSSDPTVVLAALNKALIKQNSSIKTKAGVARRFVKHALLMGSTVYANVANAIARSVDNVTPNQNLLFRNVELFEVPEMETDYHFFNGDNAILLSQTPGNTQGGIIQVNREGLEVRLYGPEDTYVLNRRDLFDYIADFRRSTVMGWPESAMLIKKGAVDAGNAEAPIS